MRRIKLKKPPARNPLVRLGIVPTKAQKRDYLLELKATKTKFVRAKKTITVAGKKRIAA